MTAALSCPYTLRAVAPRRVNCRGFGPGSFIAASARAFSSRAGCCPSPGMGSKVDPATISRAARASLSRLTINSACQPNDEIGRSIFPHSFHSPVVPMLNNSMGTTDDASIARG